MDATQRSEGRTAARNMSRTVETESVAFLASLGIKDPEGFALKPVERLSELDNYFAQLDPTKCALLRRDELVAGMGYICALVYQQAVIPFGIGWLFCEDEHYPRGKVVLGPGITETPEGFALFYEDPFATVELNWDQVESGRISSFFGRQVPCGLADSYARVAISVAHQNGQWIPPMFYLPGIEYND